MCSKSISFQNDPDMFTWLTAPTDKIVHLFGIELLYNIFTFKKKKLFYLNKMLVIYGNFSHFK